MTPEDMRRRTRQFSLRVVRLAESLPRTRAGAHVANQMLRSGTSVAANYRAACRARSRAEFVAKLSIVEEEADETVFWIDFAVDIGLAESALVKPLLKEGNEIVAIIVRSRQTAKAGATQVRN